MSFKEVLSSLDELPTTRIRILVTILLIGATGVVYLYHACAIRHPQTYQCIGWEPSANWYVFLSALAGVDLTQYFAKSFTSVKHAQVMAQISANGNGHSLEDTPEDEDVTSSTDISELNQPDSVKG